MAKEICDILGIVNPSKAVSYLDNDVKQTLQNVKGLTASRNPTVIIVNESGLYQLIFRSNKLVARAFRRWVPHAVLPTIRKTGWYRTDPTTDNHPATCLPAT